MMRRPSRCERGAWALGIVALAIVGAVTLGGAFVPSLAGPRSASVPSFLTDGTGGSNLSLDPYAGYVGVDLWANGSALLPNSNYSMTFGATSIDLCAAGTLTTDAGGNLSCAFGVPAVPAGAYSIVVTNGSSSAAANFTVEPSSILLAPDDANVSGEVVATGAGFVPDALLALSIGATPITSCTEGSLSASAAGALNCTFTVPVLAAGPYSVEVTDGVNPATTAFVVNAPTLELTPIAGSVASFVRANGTGFAPAAPLTLQFGTTAISSCAEGGLTSNSTGGLFCTFQVPGTPSGPVTVVAGDGTNSATGSYSVEAPGLTVAPGSGVVGTSVTATGSGFAASALLTLEFGSATIAASSCTTGSLTTDAGGALDCTFDVPVMGAGPLTVSAADGFNTATAGYTVDPPSMMATPSSGPVGSTVEVTGAGFAPSVSVALEFDGLAIDACAAGSLVTSSGGALDCSFEVPAVPTGSQSLTASDGTNVGASSFTVVSNLTLAPGAGTVASGGTATGTGFDASSEFLVQWNASYDLCTGVTAANGSFSCGFTVPPAAAGPHTVTAVEGANAPTALFSVAPSFLVAPGSGAVGSSVAVTGAGFDASSGYEIQWDGAAIASGTTTTNGGLSVEFAVPDSPGGAHLLGISEGTNLLSSSFTVSPTLAVTPTTGIPGTPVTLVGDGLASSVTYDDCLASTVVACGGGSPTFTTDTDGNIPSATGFTVPSVAAGGYYVVVSSDGTVATSAPFLVATASLTLQPPSGPVGTVVGLSGSGYTAESSYAYCFASTPGVCPDGAPTFTASGGGAIPSAVALTVPTDPAGTYDVDISVASTFVAAAPFAVSPSWSLAPGSGPAESLVTASGAGFDASATFTVAWNATTSLCDGTTAADGALECQGTVPAAPAGTYALLAVEGGYAPAAEFTVLATATISPGAGPVGAAVQVSGTGFPSRQPFSVSWNTSALLCGGTTAVDGSWSCIGLVPASPAGSYTLNASSGSQIEAVAFAVSPSVTISDLSGYVGSSVSVTGMGFNASTPFSIEWDSTLALCFGSTDTLGEFGCTFDVPDSPAGAHTVAAVQGSFPPPTEEFVVNPYLALTPSSGVVGTAITATGTGFGASAGYTIEWNGSEPVCTGTTDLSGSFVCDFSAPSGPYGVNPVTAIQGSNEASTSFGLGSSFSLLVNSGPVGSAGTAVGLALAASAPYTVAWNTGSTLCSGTTSSAGAFSCAFTVPAGAAGPHAVTVTQGRLTLGATFSIVPSGSVAPGAAESGNRTLFSGIGFDAGALLTVAWNSSTLLCSGLTNASGGFACEFTVPTGAPGPYNLTVTEGGHSLLLPFTVTATPPPSPAPASTSAFPWDLVVVGLAILVALLVILIFAELRRPRRRPAAPRRPERPGSGTGTLEPWAETAAAVPGGSAPVGPAAGVPVGDRGSGPPSSPTAPGGEPSEGAGEAEDIDALIARLERMNEQLFQKKPPAIGEDPSTSGK